MRPDFLTHWGLAERYVFRFPEPQVRLLLATASFSLDEIETSAKLLGWLELDGVPPTDYDRIAGITGMIDKDPATLRHYRKLFEQAGLVVMNQRSNRLVTTPLGRSMRTFVEDATEAFNARLESLAREVVKQLARYQLRNPANSDVRKLPASCDIFPYWCIWKAMRVLDDRIHHEEMNRVLLNVMRMDGVPKAIEAISEARRSSSYEQQLNQNVGLDRMLGKRAHDEQLGARKQESSRIIPWFTLAGYGGLFIEPRSRANGFRYLQPRFRGLLDEALGDRPKYREFSNRDEWIRYFVGLDEEDRESF